MGCSTENMNNIENIVKMRKSISHFLVQQSSLDFTYSPFKLMAVS